jgi:hypothetical protein
MACYAFPTIPSYRTSKVMPGAVEVSTSSFGDEIIKGMAA